MAVSASPQDATAQYRIWSGGEDGMIQQRTPSGQPIGEPFKGHDKAVLSIAVSPDGQRIASGSADSSLKIWGRKRE